MSISVSVLVSGAGPRPQAPCSPPSSLFPYMAHSPFFTSTYLCLNPLGSLVPSHLALAIPPAPSRALVSSYPPSSLVTTWPSSNSPLDHLVPASHSDFPSTSATYLRPNQQHGHTSPNVHQDGRWCHVIRPGISNISAADKDRPRVAPTTTPCGSSNTSWLLRALAPPSEAPSDQTLGFGILL